MRGYNKWHYKPYRPAHLSRKPEKPYICRLAPRENHLDGEIVFKEEHAPYSVYYANVDDVEYSSLDLDEGKFHIANLQTQTEYKIYVQDGQGVKSDVRRFRTGYVPGSIVNYLHPSDKYYDFSGRYLCSPSIIKLPTGDLLASMDLHAGSTPQNLTLLFRSSDDGNTWSYVCDIFPCFWGKLFIHKEELYMLGVSNEYGDLLIGKSDDWGDTWGEPTVISRGAADTNEIGHHRAPMQVIHSNGRLWTGTEYGAWRKRKFYDSLLSIDEDADLLVAENWSLTEYVDVDESWADTIPGIAGAIEGNAVEAPNGDVLNILRYAPNKALVLKADISDPDAPLAFNSVRDFPLAHTKFEIKRHSNGLYYAAGNTLPARTVLSIYFSSDLKNWEELTKVVDASEYDTSAVGFQYPAFDFDGDDIILLSRTAYNQAANFHDSNFITFHRIPL